MDYRSVICALIISALLLGTVAAQKTVNDFKITDSYTPAENGTYSLYLNQKHDSGIAIYKYLAGDDDDNDTYDDLVHDEGSDYLTADDDFKLDLNSDNTFNFTDYDHAEHGVGEVIEVTGDQFVVVFWAKNANNATNADLISQLNEFNKDNNVNAVAF